MQFLIEQIAQMESKRAINQESANGNIQNNADQTNKDDLLSTQTPSNSILGAFTVDFEDQLYQLAAGKNYDSLVLILDKLTKGIILQTHERKILADFAFMIREDPQKALHKLNQMKFRLDKINTLKKVTKTKQGSSVDPEVILDSTESKEPPNSP